MEVTFEKPKLEALCASKKNLTRKYGVENANKVALRVTQLRAADSLADIGKLPGVGCHELQGSREGELAVRLSGGYRLVFTPEGDDILKPDGGLDWSKIAAVVIQAIEDYH